MRSTVFLVSIFLCAWPSLATSQAIERCELCLRDQKSCQTTSQMCSLECRARHFVSDPKRDQCISACSATAAQCAQTAVSACLSQNACPR
jgi:hypothetical protein